ncbi:MAG: ABC transporter ATP-binding protein [Anaerolineae bacterium]|nr:ABC transporter ATP-binding protein [Anaerolineae bacterium]
MALNEYSHAPTTSCLVRATDLTRTYQTGNILFHALRGVSIEIPRGDFCCIMGHSGSGKSTLLHLVGGLDQPTAGSVEVGDYTLNGMNQTALARFRRTHVGFVFQFFNLVENLTVRDNVELPALLAGKGPKKEVRARSRALLDRLGIGDQSDKHPWELSGGQQQRVAIARALINEPTLLLADEPTGNLDSTSGQGVLDILSECHELGQTVLMVTHDPLAAARASEILFIHDGQIVDRMPGGDAVEIAHCLAAIQ